MTFILYWHKFLNDYLWGLSLSLSSKYWPKEICPRPLILSEDEQKYHLPIGPRFGWSGKQCIVGVVIKQAVTGRAGAGLVGDLADPCRLGQGVNGGHWLGRLDTACSRFLLIWPIILLSKKIQHFKIKKILTYSLVYNMKCRDHLQPDIFINYQSYLPHLTLAFFASLLQPLEGLLPLQTWALLLLEAGERTHSFK